MSSPDWIAAEFSFAGLHIWLMQGAEEVESQTHQTTIDRLPEFLGALPQLPIIMADLTGHLGQGEPVQVPHNAKLQTHLINLGGRDIYLVRGAVQNTPPAFMHGQTAYIAGLLAAVPQFDGVICVTGAHSFWVRISAGEICYFQGYMTGDLLDHINGSNLPENAAVQPEFQSALDEAISRPQRAYGHLLHQRGGALAGSLIGLELADAKSYWLGENVIVTGATALSPLYAEALRRQGVTVHDADSQSTLLAGLRSVLFTENVLRDSEEGSTGSNPPRNGGTKPLMH